MEALWNAHQNDTPDVSQEYLLGEVVGSSQERLKDTFKRLDGWQTLIVPGGARGTFRLNI